MTARMKRPNPFWSSLILASMLLIGAEAAARSDTQRTPQDQRLLNEAVCLITEGQTLLFSRASGTSVSGVPDRLTYISTRLRRISTRTTDPALKLLARRVARSNEALARLRRTEVQATKAVPARDTNVTWIHDVVVPRGKFLGGTLYTIGPLCCGGRCAHLRQPCCTGGTCDHTARGASERQSAPPIRSRDRRGDWGVPSPRTLLVA